MSKKEEKSRDDEIAWGENPYVDPGYARKLEQVDVPPIPVQPKFEVSRSPQARFGFYAVTKGPQYLSNTDEKRFVSVDAIDEDAAHWWVTQAEWDSMMSPQDFSQLPAFQSLYAALPQAINQTFWRLGVFASPMLDNRAAMENAITRFRQLLEEAVAHSL